MNEYLKLLLAIVFMYLLSQCYKYVQMHEKMNDEVQHYDLVKQFLIEDNTNAISKNKKPIMWIHLDYQVNAREWENFFSRSSKKINQPYLYLTLKSIINQCGKDFSIALIDDTSFSYLLPQYTIDFSKLANPIKKHYQQMGLCKLLQQYGGFLVPPSFLCFKSLKPIYDNGLQNADMFMIENKVKYYSKNYYAPDPRFMACVPNSPSMLQLVHHLERLNSVDYTEQQDFEGSTQEFCKQLVDQQYIVIVNAKHIGVQTKNKKPIDLSDLMISNELDFCNELYGILIPQEELLSRTQYQWFLRLTPEEVLTSNTIIAKYMLNHLSLPCN